MRYKHGKNNSGQVMIVSVILLGGILLSSAAVAGTLLAYQIRQANDVKKSSAAFYAADSGMEAASFCLLKPYRCPVRPPYCPRGVCYVRNLHYPMDKDFKNYSEKNGPIFTVTEVRDPVTREVNVISKGAFENAIRALEAIFILP